MTPIDRSIIDLDRIIEDCSHFTGCLASKRPPKESISREIGIKCGKYFGIGQYAFAVRNLIYFKCFLLSFHVARTFISIFLFSRFVFSRFGSRGGSLFCSSYCTEVKTKRRPPLSLFIPLFRKRRRQKDANN